MAARPTNVCVPITHADEFHVRSGEGEGDGGRKASGEREVNVKRII